MSYWGVSRSRRYMVPVLRPFLKKGGGQDVGLRKDVCGQILENKEQDG